MQALDVIHGSQRPTAVPLAVIPMDVEQVVEPAPTFLKRRRLDHAQVQSPPPPPIPLSTRPDRAAAFVPMDLGSSEEGAYTKGKRAEVTRLPPISLDIKNVAEQEGDPFDQLGRRQKKNDGGAKVRERDVVSKSARRVQFRSPLEEDTPDKVREAASAKVVNRRKKNQGKRVPPASLNFIASSTLSTPSSPGPSSTTMEVDSPERIVETDQHSSPIASFESTPETDSDLPLPADTAPQADLSPKWPVKPPPPSDSSDSDEDMEKHPTDKVSQEDLDPPVSATPAGTQNPIDRAGSLLQQRMQAVADQLEEFQRPERVSASCNLF